MTKDKTPPSKPAPPADKPKRAHRRKTRIEDHPEVQAWAEAFVQRTESEQGYTPTRDQALQAWLVAALKLLGAADAS